MNDSAKTLLYIAFTVQCWLDVLERTEYKLGVMVYGFLHG